MEPDTLNEPVIWKVLPTANTKLLLLALEVPFPIIKALFSEDDILYWPCACWYLAAVIVPIPSACENDPDAIVLSPSACE